MFGFTRNMFILIIFALSVLLPGFTYAAGDAIVSVSAPGSTLNPGEQFTVDISVVPNNDIAGTQFDLSFDPDIITADSIVEGNLFNQGGADTFFNPGQIDNVAGTISGTFGAITTPGQTVSTEGTLAVITFTAGSTGGTSPLTLSNVIIGDINGQSVSLSSTDGTVSVNRPPVLTAIGSKTVTEGQTLQFTVSATDPDNDPLTLSASNLPTGATFNATTGVLSWTPSYSQSGSYTGVHFEVSDGNASDTEDITIIVNNIYQPDVTSDGLVNVLDMISVAQNWDETGANGWIPEDVDENGTVNILDIILIGQYWTG